MTPPPDAALPRCLAGAERKSILGTTAEPHRSPTLAYLAGREAVLGRRVAIPLDDPAAAVEAIGEALGGRQLAGAFIAQMVAEAGPHTWPVDADGGRFDYEAVYGQAVAS